MSRNSRYPQHKYSEYIDSDFSFNNQVNYPSKVDLVDRMKNMRCDGSMMLEPRLQEYLKKKKYYKHNNIQPCVSLEKEYQITSRDRKILRNFLKGRTDLYNTESLDKYETNRRDKVDRKKFFPSKEFRHDPRVPELKKSTPENELPVNRGMFYPDEGTAFYEDPIRQVNPMMDSRDFASTDVSGFSFDNQRFDPRTDPRMNPGPETENKYASQYRIGQQEALQLQKERQMKQKYGSLDPRNNYIQSNLYEQEKEIRNNSGIQMSSGNQAYSNFANYQNNDYNLITSQDVDQFNRRQGYGNFGQQHFSEKSTMDLENKMVIPKVSHSSKKDLNTASYQMMPYFADPSANANINIDTETAMIRGMPSHTTKSYGYRNPAEHYYDYDINGDFGPEAIGNLVEPWIRGGMSTRRDNKMLARQRAYRETM